ncbi:hypothetical protein [Brevundimonas denitrificans]
MDVSLATLLLSAASGVVVGLFLAVFGGGGSGAGRAPADLCGGHP